MSVNTYLKEVERRINSAVQKADTTQKVVICPNAIAQVADCFKQCFGDKPAVIIADKNTYPAAGQAVMEVLVSSGKKNIYPPLIITAYDLYAEYKFVDEVIEFLIMTPIDAVPIAVGSGTINDLVKLASHKCGREYMTVATAASMDGYSSYGASITKDGFKQTFFCPAPVAVIADVDIIAKAPKGMNSSGYADLIAKIPAGADWIVADALGVESINKEVWSLVQTPLCDWIDHPASIQTSDKVTLVGLMEGLIMSGLAMQAAQSSRPASGAEHQFSHLWDDQHHTHNGITPSHGNKVGIGSIASEALYESVLKLNIEDIKTSVEHVKSYWPEFETIETMIKSHFEEPVLARQIIKQSRAKYIDVDKIAKRLNCLINIWPELKERLNKQLLGPARIQEMIKLAGAPSLSTEIGIDYDRLHLSYRLAQLIRQRYTIFDLVLESGNWNSCVNNLFDFDGFWYHKSIKPSIVIKDLGRYEFTEGIRQRTWPFPQNSSQGIEIPPSSRLSTHRVTRQACD